MASTDTANQAILDRLEAIQQFHPATANLFADWTLDPGDVVQVLQGDKTYRVPIYQMDIDWKGKSMVEVQSTGSERRPPLPALRRGGTGGRAQTETEKELFRQRADIDKSNSKISLWATDEEWNEIAQEWQETGRSQLDITSKGISSIVTGVDAGNFSETQQYHSGDIVMRYGKLYGFIVDHLGPWNSQHVTQIQDVYGKVQRNTSRIEQTNNSISLIVDSSTGMVTPGKIRLAINGEGGSEAVIQADKIDINGLVTALAAWDVTVMDLSAQDITANGNIEGHLIGDVQGDLDGDVLGEGHTGYFQSGLYVGTSFASVGDGIADVQIRETSTGSGVYHLQFKRYGDSTWTDDTTTFSRATVTPVLTGSWSGGVYSVTSNPAASNQPKSTEIYGVAVNGTPYPSPSINKRLIVPVKIVCDVPSGGDWDDGETVWTGTVGANAEPIWDAGYDKGEQDMLDMYDVVSISSGTPSAGTGANIDVPLSIEIGDDLSGNTKTVMRTPTVSVSTLLYTDTATITTTAHQMTPPSGKIGFASVTIPAANVGTKTVTANDTYNASDDGLLGYSSVVVNVSGSTGTISLTNATYVNSLQGLAYALGTDVNNLTRFFSSTTIGAAGYYGFKITCGSANPRYYYFQI